MIPETTNLETLSAQSAQLRRSVEIIIPIYKPELNMKERHLVDRTLNILQDYPTTFICPIGLDLQFYWSNYPRTKFKFFETKDFSSVRSYSRLLLSVAFYKEFIDREFILIVQPDVYIVKNDLVQWLRSNYDYIGAPWPNGLALSIQSSRFMLKNKALQITAYVGNGGFSLRRVEKCISLLQEHKEVAAWFQKSGSNEDLYFSFMGGLSQDFLIPNQVIASTFSMEMSPDHFFSINGGQLPMGIHAFGDYSTDFWAKHIQDSFPYLIPEPGR